MSVERSEFGVERSAPRGAVFLSYASQDAEAARRICEALRAAGVEVWFDQSELVGGDAWDQKIRRQIGSCALLIPIISANTQARREGYFRLEWRLAVERMRQMDDDLPFLLPVVIDDTKDAEAFVPERFREVQWTRVQGGEPTQAFCKRVQRLLQRSELPPAHPQTHACESVPASKRPGLRRGVWRATAIVVAVGAGIFALTRRDPPPPAVLTGPRAEARELVAKAWEQLNRTGLYRTELEIADGLLKRAAELAQDDPEVWAAWAHVDAWYVYHNFDLSPERREGARQKAARAMRLDAQSYESRLADACYIVRATGAQPGAGRGGDALPAAERTLRDLVQERPDDHRPRFALGILLRNARRFDDGAAEFERMAVLPGRAATAWSEIGWLRQFAGDSQRALEAADRSIAAQPFFGNLLLRLQLARYWTGDLELAKSAAAQLPPSLRPEDIIVASTVELFRWRREPGEMLRILDAVPRAWIASQGFNGPKFFMVAQAHQMAGREDAAQLAWREALRLIEQRLEKEADSGSLLALKARTLGALGRQTEARQTARLAESFGAAENLDLLLELGEPDRALTTLEELMAAPTSEVSGATRWAELKLNPRFDPVRANPRFQRLLAQAEADPRRNPHASRSPFSGLPPPSQPPMADAKSVAVLAFANLSDDQDNEYFSDGISEELLNVLAKVPGLKVSARTSAFHFKGRDTPIPEIARQLGVAYVVEGSVRKQGDRVRITAQLIKAADGFHVWSDTFTRDLKDIFAVQDEIARLIAQALSLRLGAGSAAATARVNPEALQLYLQGRQLWSMRLPETLDRAEELFQQALRLDPGLAQARSGLADVWLNRGNSGADPAIRLGNYSGRDSPEIGRIIAEAEAALAQDPSLAEPHATIGNALSSAWDIAGALRSLQRATELNPNYAPAHQWLGRVWLRDGRMPEGLAALERAAQLDPLSPIILDNYGMGLLFAGRPADALPVIERALLLRPDHQQTLAWKIWALTDLGRKEEALKLARAVELNRDEANYDNIAFASAYALRAAGETEEAEAFARKLAGYHRFIATVGSGKPAEALPYLDPPLFSNLLVHYLLFLPALDPVRGDPRFVSALATLGLTEAHARAQAWRAANPGKKPETRE